MMRRSVYFAIALLMLMATFGVPARANGVDHGRYMTLAVEGLPDVCPTGAAMEGKAFLYLAADGTRAKKAISVEISVETPFGDLPVYEASFRMRPGTTRAIPLSIPVAESAPGGMYTLTFDVSTKEETVTVSHTVRVVPPM